MHNLYFTNFECNEEKENVQGPSNAPAPARENTLPTITSRTSANLLDIIGPYPFQPPTDFKWVLKWDLVPSGQASASTPGSETSLATSTPNFSFENVFLGKVKPPKARETRKRTKFDLRAKACVALK